MKPFSAVDISSSPFLPRDFVLRAQDAPSVVGSEVSDDLSLGSSSLELPRSPSPPVASPRERLRWEFNGLTLWLEYDEVEGDLTKAIDDAVTFYGIERIPTAHSTAIYGMTHLSVDDAKKRLHEVVEIIPQWPLLDPARGITQGIAEEGKPGQVCSIAWAELTFSTNDDHEIALDKLYKLFDMPTSRASPWTPHISFAYDNPEETVLNMPDTLEYVSQHPSLMGGRRIKSVSLWDTNGKMGDFKCLDRVYFQPNDS